MNYSANIYDIDGKLIHKAGDTNKLTYKEAKERIEYYKNILKDTDKDDKKYSIYTSYIQNLSVYLLNLYAKMTPEERNSILAKEVTKETTQEEVEKVMNDLKNSIEHEEHNGPDSAVNDQSKDPGQPTVVDNVEQPLDTDTQLQNTVTQEDLLVERDDDGVVMDEYVEFEEV